MKFVFASDVHGSIGALQFIVDKCISEKADRLILTGDITGFTGYGIKDVLNPVRTITSAVLGNCDSERAVSVLGIPYDDYGVVRADGFNIFFSHGHRISQNNPPGVITENDALVCGHTHIPVISKKNGFLFANPGSCARPRGGFKPSFMIYDSGCFKIFDFDGNVMFSELR